VVNKMGHLCFAVIALVAVSAVTSNRELEDLVSISRT
jgi:hypothetical protein